MKRFAVVLTIAAVVSAAAAAPPGKTGSGFDRLKDLVGTWKGRDSQGNGTTSTFRLVADETSIMETLIRGEANETIVRVFYVDNGTLMLTQYGTRGNLPRLKIDRQKSTENTFAFSLQDVTNPGGDQSLQIRDLILDMHDRSLLTESWTVRTGKTDAVETSVMERTLLDRAGAGLERMKSLVGSWKGKDTRGNSVNATYALVADGTGLLETLDIAGSKENMVTVYALSNGNTVLTHYCSMGNQPRMKLDGPKSTESRLVYLYVDATNVKSDRDPRMRDLTVTFKDNDHFSQEWTLRIEGKATTSVFEFERVKQQEGSSGW